MRSALKKPCAASAAQRIGAGTIAKPVELALCRAAIPACFCNGRSGASIVGTGARGSASSSRFPVDNPFYAERFAPLPVTGLFTQ